MTRVIAMLRDGSLRGGALPAVTLLLLLFLIVPVPAWALDIGFVANIALSLAVLMVALGARRALDFSSFPTVLLFATLLRLALNVASTRVVLVSGHEGSAAAGKVIEAFGHILIGGDYIVGLFVFAVLMIINLVVITKGAGRVSEVSARFTLDALPGKQMAIDADLNAGLLTPEEARARRAEVATEADFYGSMDGASKFVSRDAIAGVLILFVNIVGGIILGIVSHGMAAGDAAQTYIMLAIGDALVAQVPALLLSIAAAVVVTRVSSPLDLAGQIGAQFGASAAWMPVAGILALIGIVPGMPHLVILPAAAGTAWIARTLRRAERAAAAAAARPAPIAAPNPGLIGWDEVADLSGIALDIGYALVPLVDDARGAPLMARITGIRRQLSRDLGFVIPLVRVRDDMTLPPNAWRISVRGLVVGEGEAWPQDLLALDATGAADAGQAGTSHDQLQALGGRRVKDPSFGLDAVWIRPDQRVDAVVAGLTVVDAATVIATQLHGRVTTHAHALFGLDEARALIDAIRPAAPQLADALAPPAWPLAQVAAVGRALLAEGLSLRDPVPIAEALVAMRDGTALAPADAADQVRRAIGGRICQTLAGPTGTLMVLTLDPALEGIIADAVRLAPAGEPAMIDPDLARRLGQAVRDATGPLLADGHRPAIVTAPGSRRALVRLLAATSPEVAVLSFLEIPDTRAIDVVAVIGAPARPEAVADASYPDDSHAPAHASARQPEPA